MGFKFIVAADIHLDSPLQGLSRYEGAPVDVLRVFWAVSFFPFLRPFWLAGD
jgi:hypothetical protein